MLLVWVEAIGGLVENQDLGVVHDGLREAGAVAVAFRKRLDALVPDGLEESGLDGFIDRFVTVGPEEAAHFCAKPDEAGNRHVLIEWGVFREVADFEFCGVWISLDIDPIDENGAARRGDVAGDHAHGRGFAGTVGSEESEDFALFHRKTEIVYCGFGPECLRQVGDFNHRKSEGYVGAKELGESE